MSINYVLKCNGCLYAATDDGISDGCVEQHVTEAKIQRNDYFALTVAGQVNTYNKNTSLYNLSQYMAEVFFKKIEDSNESTLFERCEEAYNSVLNDKTVTFDPRPPVRNSHDGSAYIRVIGKEKYDSGNDIIIRINYLIDVVTQKPTANAVQIIDSNISTAGGGWSTLGKSDQDILNEIDSYINVNKCSDKDAIGGVLKKYATNNKEVAFNSSPIIVCEKLP